VSQLVGDDRTERADAGIERDVHVLCKKGIRK
jgi:hypothetical protein